MIVVRISGTPISRFHILIKGHYIAPAKVFFPGFLGDYGFKILPVPGFFRILITICIIYVDY